jgi:GntR family transcriptional regulator / MocR family aminotransferase
MSESRTTLAGELLLALDRSSFQKGAQLRGALRHAIADGVLQPGTQLPSTRSLAADLGVSRGLVVEVYEQLTAEGWLTARHGSGTTVATHPSVSRPRPGSSSLPVPPIAALDLRPARPDVASFPRSAWAAATRLVLADLPHHDLGYGDHRGHPRAREVVAAYLARVRGVRTTPELVVLTNGFSAGLGTVVAALLAQGSGRVAVEDPGGYEPRQRVAAAGAEVVPIPVDTDGLRVEVLERSEADAVLLTPAHQYPLGSVLSAERRAELAAWARRRAAWIIEDDYDAEFRYDRDPIGAVQGLIPERTIHLGSVAKTLAPSIRVGWVVPPEELLLAVVTTHATRVSQPATLEQLVLARLVNDGVYEGLADAGLDDRVEGVAAGLQAVLRLDDEVDDTALVAQLHEWGVEVVALSRYAVQSPARGLVIGFGQPRTHELRRAVPIIADTLRAHGTEPNR